METGSEARWAGTTSAIGGAIWILLTPAFATSYFALDQGEPGVLVKAFRAVATPLLGFGPPEAVYQTLGLVYLIPVLLVFLGFLALRAALVGEIGVGAARGLGVMLVGWLMILIGHVGDYGIGTALGPVLYNLAFVVQTLGILALVLGSLAVGLIVRLNPLIPRQLAWPLILTLPLALLGLALTGHLPSGPMLGVCLTAIAVGNALWSGAAGAEADRGRLTRGMGGGSQPS